MRSRKIDTTIRIKGGLPVRAIGRTIPPDPSVGIFSEGLEDIQLFWLKGGEVSNSVYASISDDEWDKIIEAMFEGESDER